MSNIHDGSQNGAMAVRMVQLLITVVMPSDATMISQVIGAMQIVLDLAAGHLCHGKFKNPKAKDHAPARDCSCDLF